MIPTPLPKLLDVVALLRPLPEHNLPAGQVGTILELWNNETAEVEFCDTNGRTLALTAVELTDLLVLHFHATSEKV